MPVRQQAAGVKPRHIDRRHHAAVHPRLSRPRPHRVRIGSELGRVQMAMCVDPTGHGSIMPKVQRWAVAAK
jgi:hypothetical protein